MRNVIIGLILGLALSAAAVQPQPPPPRFHLGPKVFGATTVTPGAQTLARDTVCMAADGTKMLGLAYFNASGAQINMRMLRVLADHSAVIDQLGQTIASPEPPSIATPCGQCLTAIDNALGTAAAANKLNP